MPFTVADLISDAMIEAGIIAAGETVASDDQQLALRKLNRMLDMWNAEKLNVFVEREDSFAWGTSKQIYTIGATGADFTLNPRPVRIERADYIDVSVTPNVKVDLEVFNSEQYGAIAIPALSSGTPIRLYYAPFWPLGKLYPWPFPTKVTNKLNIWSWQLLAAFAAVTDSVSFPPGFEEAVALSLAERLCGTFGRAVPPNLSDFARKARATIQALNTVAPKMATADAGLMGIGSIGGEYDYRIGSFGG